MYIIDDICYAGESTPDIKIKRGYGIKRRYADSYPYTARKVSMVVG